MDEIIEVCDNEITSPCPNEFCDCPRFARTLKAVLECVTDRHHIVPQELSDGRIALLFDATLAQNAARAAWEDEGGRNGDC